MKTSFKIPPIAGLVLAAALAVGCAGAAIAQSSSGSSDPTNVSSSTEKRTAPGGAGPSASSGDARTGKNELNETYNSCLGMWDRATHMSKQEWARACRRVAERITNLQVSNDAGLLGLKTDSASGRRRRE